MTNIEGNVVCKQKGVFLEQKVFHYKLKTEIVFVGEQAIKELDTKVKELNDSGWKIDMVLPIAMETGTLCHEDESVISEVAFFCTKK